MISVLKKIFGKLFPKIQYARHNAQVAAADREVHLLPILCCRDSIAIDIGANQGAYVSFMRPLVRRVIAFEPLPKMLAILHRFHGDSIQTEAVVLSDKEGTVELRFPAGDYERATIDESNALDGVGVPIQTLSVPAKTLDSFGFSGISFIKIDVEGHEEAVLRGGLETLKREMPNLLIEIEERHSTGSLRRICAMLVSIGYAGYYVDGDSLLEVESFDHSRDQAAHNLSATGWRVGTYINNFLFFPQSAAESTAEKIRKFLSQG